MGAGAGPGWGGSWVHFPGAETPKMTPKTTPSGPPKEKTPGPPKNKTYLESGPMKPAKIYIVSIPAPPFLGGPGPPLLGGPGGVFQDPWEGALLPSRRRPAPRNIDSHRVSGTESRRWESDEGGSRGHTVTKRRKELADSRRGDPVLCSWRSQPSGIVPTTSVGEFEPHRSRTPGGHCPSWAM
jgi:hypothetical protein